MQDYVVKENKHEAYSRRYKQKCRFLWPTQGFHIKTNQKTHNRKYSIQKNSQYKKLLKGLNPKHVNPKPHGKPLKSNSLYTSVSKNTRWLLNTTNNIVKVNWRNI